MADRVQSSVDIGIGERKKSTEKSGILLGFKPRTFRMLASTLGTEPLDPRQRSRDQDTDSSTGQRTQLIPAGLLSHSWLHCLWPVIWWRSPADGVTALGGLTVTVQAHCLNVYSHYPPPQPPAQLFPPPWFQWLSGKNIWLAFGRSWVQIPDFSVNFFLSPKPISAFIPTCTYTETPHHSQVF